MGKINTIKRPASSMSKKRVAAYARVSMESERLAHSLAAQISYYDNLIHNNPEWEFAGIYADSFITGTTTTKRAEFQRLIADCERGKIDIILCKSISRFSRNTVDLLNTVRRLKELDVDVRFEKENIRSLSGDGELMLTILASFAQEESRSISENVKWGIRRRYQSGTAGMRNKCVFGYRFDGEKYVIVPEEAEIVRFIFDEYIKGVSLRRIMRSLNDSGAKTWRGFDFSCNPINYIVHNEIYAGKIVLQKYFVKDYITHVKVKNRGEYPQYFLCDRHEPIIDSETFAMAQKEAERRAATKPVYCFSKKIVCGGCGKLFTRRSNNGKYACWHCRECSNIKLKEDKLKALSARFLGTEEFDEEEFGGSISGITANKNGRLEIRFFDGRLERCRYE